MTWSIGLIALIVWLLLGFLSCVWAVYDGWKKGDDITLFDVFLVVITTFAGPVFTVWLIAELMEGKGEMVLLKGKGK
uniref:TMhelix containing protein n=2 Tax=unclassified bacterial viruses TaxID=12333 RepID=A0AAU6VYA1_9VIRU